MPLQNRVDPEPSDLKTPWRTEARIELQMEARVFARDIVLPIADGRGVETTDSSQFGEVGMLLRKEILQRLLVYGLLQHRRICVFAG